MSSALDDTLSGPVDPTVVTGAASESELQSSWRVDPAEKEAWLRMIDDFLVEWGANPQVLAADGIEPPEGDTIAKAIKWAEDMSDRGFVAPSRVVPTGDGGIAFELHVDDVFQSFDIESDGKVFLTTYVGRELQARFRIA